MLFGEVVQGFRNSLDHIAWEVVQRGTMENLTSRQEKSVHFPIASTRKAFNDALHRRLPGVRPADRAIIRRHQPYVTGKRTVAWHCLSTLQTLSNNDKHRTIQPVQILPTGLGFHVTAARDCVPGSRQHGSTAVEPLNVGTELGLIRVRRTGPEPHIDVEPTLTTLPATDEHFFLNDWMHLGFCTLLRAGRGRP